MRILFVALVLGGCRKDAPSTPPVEGRPLVEPARPGEPALGHLQQNPLLVGPTRFRQAAAGGLGIDVPVGWNLYRGTGPGAFARLVHVETDVSVVVRIFDEPTAPGDWSGCLHVDDDPVGRYRWIPALYPATSRTCMPAGAEGPLRRAWYGSLDQRYVHVEVALPPGTLISAERLLRPVMSSLGSD